jgi:hypothetical protein
MLFAVPQLHGAHVHITQVQFPFVVLSLLLRELSPDASDDFILFCF